MMFYTKVFDIYLDEKRQLKPCALVKLGLSSRIVMDFICRDIVEEIYCLNKRAQLPIVIHHAEYSHEEKIKTFDDFDNAWQFIFDHHFEDKIIRFLNSRINLWDSGESDFFVIFGQEDILKQITPEKVSDETFLEMLDEDTGLSKQGREYRLEALKKYGMNRISKLVTDCF